MLLVALKYNNCDEGKLYLCRSLDDAIHVAHELTGHLENKDLSFSDDAASVLQHAEAAIIGGAQLCEAAMPQVDRLYLTVIDAGLKVIPGCTVLTSQIGMRSQ